MSLVLDLLAAGLFESLLVHADSRPTPQNFLLVGGVTTHGLNTLLACGSGGCPIDRRKSHGQLRGTTPLPASTHPAASRQRPASSGQQLAASQSRSDKRTRPTRPQQWRWQPWLERKQYDCDGADGGSAERNSAMTSAKGGAVAAAERSGIGGVTAGVMFGWLSRLTFE